MRINCPYCGTWLTYEVSSTAADWMFLRCASCSSLCISKSGQKKKSLLPKHVFSPFVLSRPEAPQHSEGDQPLRSVYSSARSKKPLALGVLGLSVFAASLLVDTKPVSEAVAPPQDQAIVIHQSAPAQIIEVQKVEVQAQNATLRSGPGINYRKMGIASSGTQFSVLAKENSWIKVEIQFVKEGALQTRGQNFAWIRSDLVKAVSFVNSNEVAP